MKIWCISDTHMNHNTLVIPNGIDIVIHSGDSTNFKNPILNKIEFDAFSDWFIKLNIKNKILIAGNHDAWALKKYNTSKLKDNNYKCEILKILGHKNDPGVDILSIVCKYGINDTFSGVLAKVMV